ncbi:MAG: TonB-dependent receptor [Lentisphaeria bacterium]|nr:TonB-dependent receptor [Lentisphaeria bacterium]
MTAPWRSARTMLAGMTLLGGLVAQETLPEEAAEMDPVVVTATHAATPLREVGQAVTVITRQEIEDSQWSNLTDALRQIPGIDFRANGPHATTSNLSIRGLEGYHTKVLINGIPLQDTSTGQQMPLLNDINLDDIERIEVLRGPGSTVHGSNALGGVVNIITRSGRDAETPTGSVEIEYGSHGRVRTAGSIRGSEGPLDFSLSLLRESENGISAQNTPLNGDDDPWRQQQVQGAIGIQLDEHLRIEFFGRYTEIDEEYDNADAAWGPFQDSGDTHHQRWMAGLRLLATDLLDGCVDSSLTASVTELARGYRDTDGWSLNDRYQGRTTEYDWKTTVRLHERARLTVGLANTHEEARVQDGGMPAWAIPASVPVDDRHRTHAAFAEAQLQPVDDLFLTAGARWNDHSLFGQEWTWSAAGIYHLTATGTRLRASIGKAYRAPSLYELYEPNYGEPSLEPETGTAWDAGFEQDLCPENPRLTFGSTFFRNRVTDYIGFDLGTYRYGQISGIKSHGLETFLQTRPLENVTLRLSHTYTHTNNMEVEASPLAFRPRHKGSADLTWRLSDGRLTLNLNALYVAHRTTQHGGGEHLDAFLLANAAATLRVTQHVQVYLRGENLLNENYEIVPDYNEYGRVVYGGVRVDF